MVDVTDSTARSDVLAEVLLLVELPLLLIALLVVHYGGIPFGLSTDQPGWCFDHGLPGRELSGGDGVHIDHTSWPLGITCGFAGTTVPFTDWPATSRDYGFLALVISSSLVTVMLMWRARRQVAAGDRLSGEPG